MKPVPGTDTPSTPLPTFPIRLADVYLHNALVTRNGDAPEADRKLTLDPRLMGVDIEPNRRGMNVILAATVTLPYREKALLTVEAAVIGQFLSAKQWKKADLERFGQREAVSLLWPYLRSYVGQLGHMTGLSLPALPTLDVQALLALAVKPVAPPASAVRKRKSPAA